MSELRARPAAHSRSGAGPGEEDHGGRDSPGGPGRGKKKTPLLRRVQAVTGRKMAPICRTLGISRACAYRESVGRPARYARAEDRVVTAQIRTVIRTRASYGARRRPRSRQSGVRDLVQPQAHTARHESERLDPCRGPPGDALVARTGG